MSSSSGAALRIDRDELFDLLGERPELLRQLFEGMFRIGVDTAASRATLYAAIHPPRAPVTSGRARL